jgi:hypothetical protein
VSVGHSARAEVAGDERAGASGRTLRRGNARNGGTSASQGDSAVDGRLRATATVPRVTWERVALVTGIVAFVVVIRAQWRSMRR